MNGVLLARNPGLGPHVLDLGLETHMTNNLGLGGMSPGGAGAHGGAGGHWDVQTHICLFVGPTVRKREL